MANQFDFGLRPVDFSPIGQLGALYADRVNREEAIRLQQSQLDGLVAGQGTAPAPLAALGGTAPAAPAGGAPTAPRAPTFAGGSSAMRMPSDGGETESKFIGALKAGGLTNPYGLAAMAAYASHESGYKGSNIAGSWSDPSESGQPGTSGGILSWRGDRFNNMRRQTAGASDPVVAQAKFAIVENPDLTLALQNAKSPEEANRLMAEAWRFAGYNREGGENAARLNSTRAYLAKLGGAQMPNGAAQVAQADLPAPGAQNAEFRIPGQGQPEQSDFVPGSVASPAIGGRAAPVQAADAPPRITPQRAAQLRAMLANPITAPAAQAEIAKLQAPEEYGYQVVGDRLIRTSKRGTVADTGIQKPVEYGFTKDDTGNLVVTNPRTGEIRNGVAAGAGSRSLLTAEERAAAGVPDWYKGSAQLDGKGVLTYPGAGQSGISPDQASDKVQSTENAKNYTTRMDAVITAGSEAQQNIPLIGELRALGGAIETGGIAAAKAKLGEYGIKFEGSGKIEAYNALIDRLTPQQRIAGAGATSDFDARMFKGSLPRLINTPEGNALIADTMEAVAKDKVARAEIAELATRQPNEGGISRQEAMKRLNSLPSVQTGFAARMKELREAGKLKPEADAPATTGRSEPKAGAVSAPPAGAVDMLRRDPKLRDQFEQKYGRGAADRALGVI